MDLALDIGVRLWRRSICSPSTAARWTLHSYCPVDRVAGAHELCLRLTPPGNGQRACITLADEFDFEGAVAQLARASGWQPEGQGFESPQLHSSPVGAIPVGSNIFRNHFGYWLERAAAGEEILVTYREKPRVRLGPAT